MDEKNTNQVVVNFTSVEREEAVKADGIPVEHAIFDADQSEEARRLEAERMAELARSAVVIPSFAAVEHEETTAIAEEKAPVVDAVATREASPAIEETAPAADTVEEAVPAAEETVAEEAPEAPETPEDPAKRFGAKPLSIDHAIHQESWAGSSEDSLFPDWDFEEEKRIPIIGVRFRTAGKVYYFSPGGFPVRVGTHVIVETARGVEYGTVASGPVALPEGRVKQPLRPVLRVATEEDEAKVEEHRIRERKAYQVAQEKITALGLEMKLITVEYAFDESKMSFFFTADGRIDFRELVKDLASVFHMRIELRQVGVRDETKMLGGYGICGRPLCCASYLSDFIPVSIKMAKEQNLSLNPTKISGLCGRLMCCLKNEEETYEDLNKNLPGVGDEVQGADGLRGIVENVSVLRQRIRILVEVNDEKELHEYGVGEYVIMRKRRRGGKMEDVVHDAEELALLEQMEANRQAAEASSEGETAQSWSERVQMRRRRGPQAVAEDKSSLPAREENGGESSGQGRRRSRGKNRQRGGENAQGEASEARTEDRENGRGGRRRGQGENAGLPRGREPLRNGNADKAQAEAVSAAKDGGKREGEPGEGTPHRRRRRRSRGHGEGGSSAAPKA